MKSKKSANPTPAPTRDEIIASAWAAVEAVAEPARDPAELRREGWRSPYLECGGETPESRRMEGRCRSLGFEKQFFYVLATNGSRRKVAFYRPKP
jgi:hypothetical protein